MNKLQWKDGALAEVSFEPFRIYEIEKSIFREHVIEFDPKAESYRHAMKEIVDRYRVYNKKILSVGPGRCLYECWFSEFGNTIFFVDIDELEEIEPRLKKMKAISHGDSMEKITYAIGDARIIHDYCIDPFEVLLSFGFTPDEFHRAKQQKLATVSDQTTFGWPVGISPFSDLTLEIFASLPSGGLFISLSYCGGPDAQVITYIPTMSEILRQHGMTLLEVFILSESPGIHLIVAEKNEPSHCSYPNVNNRISTLHPRCQSTSSVECIFSRFEDMSFNASRSKSMAIVADIIKEKAANAKNCLYEGLVAEEIRCLLNYGIQVTIIAESSLKNPCQFFPNSAELRFIADQHIHGDLSFDLLWLAEVERDEQHRACISNTLGTESSLSEPCIFSKKTHELFSKLKTKGKVIVYGRAGIDVSNSVEFREQLQKEWSLHRITLDDLFALKIAPGIFLAIGTKGSKRPDESAKVLQFYPKAENTEAIRIVKRQLSLPIDSSKMAKGGLWTTIRDVWIRPWTKYEK